MVSVKPIQPEKQQFAETGHSEARFLVLHNDEVNTFDHVIESLVDVCGHLPEQAEQCAFFAHFKGKCDVKKGTYEFLEPYKSELYQRGLTVTIDG